MELLVKGNNFRGTSGLVGRPLLVLLILAIVILAGCRRRQPPTVPAPPVIQPGFTQVGIASWYGHPYHGRPTASGEIYDMEELTAAHPFLPLGSVIRVTNLENHRTVILVVNDRGPFVKGRILDVSREAARRLGMLGPGTARVRLTVLALPGQLTDDTDISVPREPSPHPSIHPPPTTPSAGQVFAVQVGAFRFQKNASQLCDRFENSGWFCAQIPTRGKPRLWRVLVGNFSSEAEAKMALRQLQEEFPDAFIVRLDNR